MMATIREIESVIRSGPRKQEQRTSQAGGSQESMKLKCSWGMENKLMVNHYSSQPEVGFMIYLRVG
ncbi:unnamed protein product [Prunus armeniaca]